jgi:23S rRNA (pseudouridine1915-N3)-methyltransferase
MNIEVIAVGKLKERFWSQACDEYLKRLRPYAKVSVHEVADRDPGRAGGVAAEVEREGADILAAVPERAHVILLDIQGTLVTSEDEASRLQGLMVGGTSDVAVVIGGSCGVSESVRRRADERWSFGRITMPHNLARVVALEQLYRAFKIMRGEPYHK